MNAGIAQLVEHDLAKVGVASSSLVSRSSLKDIGVKRMRKEQTMQRIAGYLDREDIFISCHCIIIC